MGLAYLDYLSTCGNSVFHRATPYSKAVFVALAVYAAIAARDLPAVLGVLGVLLGLSALAGIPPARMAQLLALPALFGLAFSAGGPLLGMLRSVSAAAAFILLLGSTTFASVHAMLARVMPRILADSVYMTYRSFFLLVEQVSAFARVLRLKGAGSISAVGAALGSVLVHSIELSERTCDVFVMRGFGAGMASLEPVPHASIYDVYPVAAGALLLLAAIAL